MNYAAKTTAALLLLFLTLQTFAQLQGAGGKATSSEGLGRTWKGPSATVFSRILTTRKTTTARPAARGASRSKPTPAAAMRPAAPTAAITFRPGPDTGVAELLTTAFTTDPSERTILRELFRQLKQSYETEVAKEGKSNNLAAAMTFFIASNVVAYHNTEMPSDEATEDFYNSIRDVMAATPEIARLTNAEKQQTHDWLVYMGGFVLLGHMNAKNTRDAASLKDYKNIADQSMRLVLGIGPANFSPSLQTTGKAASAPPSKTVDSPVIGVWTAASSSPSAMSGVNTAGTFRGRYTFNNDGTYAFKSEVWGGSMNQNMWWTTEESGTYTVNGNMLTVSPRSSKATLRNLKGVVQKTQANPLEKVTYKWTTHYFSGIQETNLVLEPPRKTNRDGVMGGNSLFPGAYLYKQGDKLAWRY